MRDPHCWAVVGNFMASSCSRDLRNKSIALCGEGMEVPGAIPVDVSDLGMDLLRTQGNSLLHLVIALKWERHGWRNAWKKSPRTIEHALPVRSSTSVGAHGMYNDAGLPGVAMVLQTR